MSSCAKETCIHSSVCMYYADRCTTNGDCGDFKPLQPKRPHGEWKQITGKDGDIICEVMKIPNFCPNCGADMRKTPCDSCIDDSDCDSCDVPIERR